MEFTLLFIAAKVLSASEERALGISRDVPQIEGDTHSHSSVDVFLFLLPKSPPSQVPGGIRMQLRARAFNRCEWQYLGRNRAYLTVLSFVLMRLYFASFLGRLISHTLFLSARQT